MRCVIEEPIRLLKIVSMNFKTGYRRRPATYPLLFVRHYFNFQSWKSVATLNHIVFMNILSVAAGAEISNSNFDLCCIRIGQQQQQQWRI